MLVCEKSIRIYKSSFVSIYVSLSVITTLEFFEHHFAKVGHRLATYDPTLFPHTHCRHLARESVCWNAWLVYSVPLPANPTHRRRYQPKRCRFRHRSRLPK
jgi:hypothetical protein